MGDKEKMIDELHQHALKYFKTFLEDSRNVLDQLKNEIEKSEKED